MMDYSAEILRELQEQRGLLERINNRLDSVDKKMLAIENDQKIIRHQFLANGKAIGEIEERCRERGRLLATMTEGTSLPEGA
jgi:hypothetical protein